jgi:hypothetical protein
MESNTVKTLAATSPQKFSFKTFREAQTEINRLKSELAAKSAAPAPAAVAPDAELEAQIFRGVTEELKAERSAPAVTGRARWNAAVVRDAGAKPATHPHLKGKDRFNAGTRISATPAASAAPATLKGRDRFNAGVAKDFSQK